MKRRFKGFIEVRMRKGRCRIGLLVGSYLSAGLKGHDGSLDLTSRFCDSTVTL